MQLSRISSSSFTLPVKAHPLQGFSRLNPVPALGKGATAFHQQQTSSASFGYKYPSVWVFMLFSVLLYSCQSLGVLGRLGQGKHLLQEPVPAQYDQVTPSIDAPAEPYYYPVPPQQSDPDFDKKMIELLNEMLNMPCGCEDDGGNAPPTFRFSPQHFDSVLQQDPTLYEVLPDELRHGVELDVIANPEDLDESELIKRGILNPDETIRPTQGGMYYFVLPANEGSTFTI